jgi:hypothetical protein
MKNEFLNEKMTVIECRQTKNQLPLTPISISNFD